MHDLSKQLDRIEVSQARIERALIALMKGELRTMSQVNDPSENVEPTPAPDPAPETTEAEEEAAADGDAAAPV